MRGESEIYKEQLEKLYLGFLKLFYNVFDHLAIKVFLP